MANERDILKPKDVKPSLIKRLEATYGPVKDTDFFSPNLDTYYKTDEVDPETNSVRHDVIKLASFGDSLEKMSKAVKALKVLMTTDEAEKDQNIKDIARNLKDVFNQYRSHLRKNYPDQYAEIKRQLEEISSTGGGAGAASFSGGTGMQYATPYAFRRKGQKANDKAYKELGYTDVKEGIGANLGPGPKASEDGVKDNAYVKQFKYKLVPKDKNGNYVQKGSGLEVKQLFEVDSASEFQKKRIAAFDQIEQELNDIYKMLSNAKNETVEYYNDNESSYAVVKPTDLVLDYVKDIKDLLKGK
tara:strand:+ start:881 stop:1783 length:903 start_codon:yes stop_codon:yes gene_type:complete